jgi:hypothetical protein
MNSEQKLLKLLQISVQNGWVPVGTAETLIKSYNASRWIELDFTNAIICFDDTDSSLDKPIDYPLDYLVTSWEQNKTGFVEALCKANNHIHDWELESNTNNYYDTHITIIRDYVATPTSLRVKWLFDKFDHLL